MELRATDRFAAPPPEVAAAMADPAFAAELVQITDVGAVEVVEHGHDGRTAWIAVRLTYDGSIDPIAARILGSHRPSWVQRYRIELDTGLGTLAIVPDHHAALLHCEAAITMRPVDTGTVREMRGTLSVRVPLLGSRAERALGPAIEARIAAEARLLQRWLSRS